MKPLQPIRFAGYASLFDVPDADRDIIRKGAFDQTLVSRNTPLPLLWQHRPKEQIGSIETLSEDHRGLRVIARIENLASRAADLLTRGQVNGLSFGYRARESRRTENGRELLSLDLLEISRVTHPLQYGARVHLIA